MTLPGIAIRRFRRVDHGAVLAVGRVAIGEYVSLPVRLIHEPNAAGPVFDIPGAADVRLGVSLAPDLAAAVLDALAAEYPHHRSPGQRTALCRRCDAPIAFDGGQPVDPVSYEPHECAAA